MKRSTFNFIALSFLGAYFFTVVVPIQTSISNFSELELTWGTLFRDCSISFVLAFFAILLAVWIGFLVLKKLAVIVFLGLVTYAYLQIGVLSLDYPEMNGETVFFCNRLRGVLDALVFPIICIFYFVLSNYLKSFVTWVVSVLLVMSTAAVFDAKSIVHQDSFSSDIITQFVPSSSVIKRCVHSNKRNVAVYIVDSIATPHAIEAFKRCPNLLDGFDGFNFYTNNIGMHISTIPGVAGLTTGLYYDDPGRIGEFSFSCFSSKSFIKTYLDAGAKIFYQPGSYSFGFTTEKNCFEETENGGQTKLFDAFTKRINGLQHWNLFEIVVFRLTPFILKPRIFTCIFNHWDISKMYSQESYCFQRVADSPIDMSCKLTLQLWHTKGSHGPMYPNHEGIYDNVKRTLYEQKIEATWYVISALCEHFNELRNRGLYDKTMIVVAADHGSTPILTSGEDVQEPFEREHVEIKSPSGRMLPILWVKPENSHGKAIFHSQPTSHAKIKELVDACSQRALTSQEVSAILRNEFRLYRVDDGNELCDCTVTADGKLLFSRTAVSRNLSDIGVIKLDHEYSLFGTNIKDPPPICFDQVFYFEGNGPRITSILRPSEFKMLVDKPCQRYRVVFKASLLSNQAVEAVQNGGYIYRIEDCVSRSVSGLKELKNWPGDEIIEVSVVSDANRVIRFIGVGKDYLSLKSVSVFEADE